MGEGFPRGGFGVSGTFGGGSWAQPVGLGPETVAAHSVCVPSPLLAGGVAGVGVAVGGRTSRNNDDPPPQPSPSKRGREQTEFAACADAHLKSSRGQVIARSSSDDSLVNRSAFERQAVKARR